MTTTTTASSSLLSHMNNNNIIKALIFDIDDTLYDVGTGFTAYRNGLGAQQFMVSHLGFPSLESAQQVRDEYFEKYHSTAKALTIAQAEGRLPSHAPKFRTEDLAHYWATQLPFEMLGGPNVQLERDLKELLLLSSSCSTGDADGSADDHQNHHPVQLVAFSNSPRQYAQRVLEELHLLHLFTEEEDDDDNNSNNTLHRRRRRFFFAVEDVLPFCKPEREAFDQVLTVISSGTTCSTKLKAEECVLIEDSMKNIRKAKEIGMKTVLVIGKGRRLNKTQKQQQQQQLPRGDDDNDDNDSSRTQAAAAAAASEATKPGDAPMEDDPSVDVCIETINELRSVLPGLWQTPSVFEPCQEYKRVYYR